MFKKLAPLNALQHRQLRFAASQPYDFARQEMLVPIVASEAFLIAREYPIVFSVAGQPQAMYALTGVDRGVNGYITPSGHWMGRYVPAHVRRYPFILTEQPSQDGAGEQGQRNFIMQIDQDAPHLNTDHGVPLFTDEGEAQPVLGKIKEILTNLQQDADRTRFLVEQLDEAGVLVEDGLRVQPKEGKTTELKGFRLIDVKALAAVAPEVLAKLRNSGALALAYAQLVSLTNLRDGVLTAPKGTPAGEALAVQNATAQLNGNGGANGSISFDGIDWSKFN